MKRLALLLALTGCAKHPAVTVAVAAGSIGLLTCEVNGASFWDAHDQAHVQGTCGIITGAVVVALGGLAALVTAFADTQAHELGPDEEITPEGAVKLHTHTELPPVPLDAGVIDAPAPDAPIVDAAAADAP
jgi:hypothetical protein